MPVILAAAAVAVSPPARVEAASEEDCAVIAAVGVADLGWTSSQRPIEPVYADADEGSGVTFHLSCDWKAFSVPSPPTAVPGTSGYRIHKPEYKLNGRGAVVYVASLAFPARQSSAANYGPGVAVMRVALEKRDGHWHELNVWPDWAKEPGEP